MRLTPHSIGVRLLVALGAAVILCAVVVPQLTRPERSPFLAEMDRLKEIAVKISDYAEEHPGFAIGSDLDTLVTAAVLSPEDAAYFRSHGVRFHGIGTNMVTRAPVFEATHSRKDLRRLIVAYADGTVESSTLPTLP